MRGFEMQRTHWDVIARVTYLAIIGVCLALTALFFALIWQHSVIRY